MQMRPLCTWTANISVVKPQWKHNMCPLGCSVSLMHRSFHALVCSSHLELPPTAHAQVACFMPRTWCDSTRAHHPGGFFSRAAFTEQHTTATSCPL